MILILISAILHTVLAILLIGMVKRGPSLFWAFIFVSAIFMALRRWAIYLEPSDIFPIENISLLITILQLIGFYGIHKHTLLLKKNLDNTSLHLKQIFEGFKGGTWEWDPISNYHRVSREWYLMLGMDPSDGSALELWKERIHPEDRPRVLSSLNDLVDKKTSKYHLDYRMIKNSGEVIWVRDMAVVLEISPQGFPTKILGTNFEITQLRKGEEAAELKSQLESFLSTLSTGTWLYDSTTGEVILDDYAKRLYRSEKNHVTLKDLSTFFHTEDLEVLAIIKEQTSRKEVINESFRYQRTPGSYRFFDIYSSPLKTDPNVYIGVTTDNTRYITLTKEIADRNRDLESFLYITTHDLQEPLRKITYYAKKIEADRSEMDIKLPLIMTSAQRMQSLLDALLTYAKASRDLKVDRFNLSTILDDVKLALILPIQEKKAQITLEQDAVFTGDRLLLTQVLQNLVGNSLKFVDENVIPNILIRAYSDNYHCYLNVYDNGIGIPSELRHKIFEPFKRLHSRNKYPGTGMGLTLVQRIIERHEGSVKVTSLTSGTKVKIKWPKKEMTSE